MRRKGPKKPQRGARMQPTAQAVGRRRTTTKPRRGERNGSHPTPRNSASSRIPLEAEVQPGNSLLRLLLDALKHQQTAPRRHPGHQTQNRFQGGRSIRGAKDHQAFRRFPSLGATLPSRRARHRTGHPAKPPHRAPQTRCPDHRNSPRPDLRQQRRGRLQRRRRPPRAPAARRSRPLRRKNPPRS